MAKASPAKLRLARILRQLEIPDCGCKVEKLDCGCGAKAEEAKELLKQLKAERIGAMLADDFEELDALDIEIHVAKCAAEYYEDCDCPTFFKWPPCKHVLALAKRAVSLADWGRWLSGFDPSIYDDPPEPPVSIQVLGKLERVQILAGRRRSKQHLWRPDDLDRYGLQIGHGVTNGRNGRPLQQDLKILIERPAREEQ